MFKGALWNLTKEDMVFGIPQLSGLGLDPHKTRSNDVCLDTIIKKFNNCFTTGCNRELDIDHDGLNQCEELTIGSNELEADTDEDSILDGLELMYGLSPTVNDHLVDSNSDGTKNFRHFVHGVNPVADFSQVPEKYKVAITSRLRDVKKEVVHDQENWSSGYFTKIDHMPVLVQESEGQSLTENKILIIIKVENLYNRSNFIWLFKTMTVTKDISELEFNLEEFQTLPHWEGYE